MFLTPIYVAMTFIRTWRLRSFRSRLLEFLGGNTSVAFCRVPENAAETPTLSSKLCTDPMNAHLCDLLDYTDKIRVCSMKPQQCIELRDWMSCTGGLPLGGGDSSDAVMHEGDLAMLLECEMGQDEQHPNTVLNVESMGTPVAWKAGSHLALVLRTDIEHLTAAGFHFVGGEFIIDHHLPVVRIQTVLLSGEPNRGTDASMRGLRSDIQHNLKKPLSQFQWDVHAALLRKLSKVVEIKSESNSIEMNGHNLHSEHEITTLPKKNISLADVSVNTVKLASSEMGTATENGVIHDKGISDHVEHINIKVLDEQQKVKSAECLPTRKEDCVVSQPLKEEIHHNVTPKKSSLKLDLKKSTSQLSSSLMNISSQIKSVTTHKKIIGPKKTSDKHLNCLKSKADKLKSPVAPPEKAQVTKSVRKSRPLVNSKQVNVLIYSESVVARDNLEASLKKVLDADRYTVYSVNSETLEAGAWRGKAALVAVAGDVGGRGAALLLAHLLAGGTLLAVCSALLHTALPHYKTAEVRENEVVQFSYDRWQSVRMKHHIFCYQASPAKKQFSTESDKQPTKYTGHPGHTLDIAVLASEETWRTPSLLLATDAGTGGRAVFSQIHLEEDPREYLGADGAPLDGVRLDILRNILGDLLGLHVRQHQSSEPLYTRGYFLGNHVHKMALVESLAESKSSCSVKLELCARGQTPSQSPAQDRLPIMLHECPEHFSTVDYFDHLSSTRLGRLVVYADVLASTQQISTSAALAHGVAVVARQQTAGRGRAANRWLSPLGSAAVTLQVWMKMSPVIPLLQHAAAVAMVRAVTELPAYRDLNIRIKWPNDVYWGREAKLGGVMTNASCTGDQVIISIGAGMNIDNAHPTACVNDVIRKHNAERAASLPTLTIEKWLARYFSILETILDQLERSGGVDAFLEQYYAHWLHEGEQVQVIAGEGAPVAGTIVGLDHSGYLRVATERGETTVHPGDNSFDLMTGLIAPKAV